MNLFTGGDLRYQMNIIHNFTEEQSKFFMACLILTKKKRRILQL